MGATLHGLVSLYLNGLTDADSDRLVALAARAARGSRASSGCRCPGKLTGWRGGAVLRSVRPGRCLAAVKPALASRLPTEVDTSLRVRTASAAASAECRRDLFEAFGKCFRNRTLGRAGELAAQLGRHATARWSPVSGTRCGNPRCSSRSTRPV
jgi:hypothetical protein